MSYISKDPCICCGHDLENEVCYHHLYSRKAYPEHSEKPWNMIPVCLKHHNEFHDKNIPFMAVKYKNVMNWIVEREWYFCKITNKWRHEND